MSVEQNRAVRIAASFLRRDTNSTTAPKPEAERTKENEALEESAWRAINMREKTDQLRMRSLLTEAVTLLCKTGLQFCSEFTVEGLLGITLDNDDIFLININETVKTTELQTKHKDSDMSETQPVIDLIHDIDVQLTGRHLSSDGGVFKRHALDGELLIAKPQPHGTRSTIVQAEAADSVTDDTTLHFSAANIVIDYSGFGGSDSLLAASGSKRKLSLIDDDLSNAVFNSDDIESILNKHDQLKDDSSYNLSGDEMSENAAAIKEGYSRSEQKKRRESSLHDGILLNTSQVDADLQSAPEVEVTATCSSWVPSSELDDMPLNLTDTQTVLPLTSSEMNQKVKRVKCEACGKSYKREQSMRKHKCKAPLDKTGASGRSQSDTTQPLDLTVCRSDGDTSLMTVDDDVDGEGAFTCVCSRVFEDYEAYVAHVNGCIKSKLTPYKSCDICGKFFFSSSGYLKHKRLHFGAYKLHCNICHKGFFDRTHLRAHTDSMHSKVRRHVCKMCGKSFFWKHHLKRHLGTCDRVKHDTSEVDAHLASVVIHND